MTRYLSYLSTLIVALLPIISFAHGDEVDEHVEAVIPPSTDERTMVAIGLLALFAVCAVGWVIIKKKNSEVNKIVSTPTDAKENQ